MPPPVNTVSHRWSLTWRAITPPPAPLPDNVTRTFITTSSGPLELLRSLPSSPTTKPPILLNHGGFGCASFYIPYMQLFAAAGYPSYALSTRGHGQSWIPSFIQMVFFTTPHKLCTDIVAAIDYVSSQHPKPNSDSPTSIILAAHSNGGGLVQLICERKMAPSKVKALVLLAGTPCFGQVGVFASWAKTDPWFQVRMYLRDLLHPRSPLSSTPLVHRAFFSDQFPRAQVRDFERFMPEYESLMWTLMTMLRFVSPHKVLEGCAGRVLIVAAENDRLMTLELMTAQAAEYKAALDQIGGKGEVVFEVLAESGHHLQNDLWWEEGGKQVLGWLEHLPEVG